MDRIEFEIGAAGESDSVGERLDRFLSGALDGISRSRVQGLIKSGHVTVDGRPTKPKHPLAPGERIEVVLPDPEPAAAVAQDIPLKLLHEDPDIAVIDKPPGMVVHPAAGNPDGTLVNALLHHFGSLSAIGGVLRPGIVHRLDKDTSGCMVVARNDTSHHALTEQFSNRQVLKVYLAVVERVPIPPHGTIETHIARNPGNRLRMAVVQPPAGKYARTDYRILAALDDSSLVECTLHTGRTHQIRVHMKQIGHPLLGDPVYAKPSRQTRKPGRLMLHAWKLGFTHPVTGQSLSFEAGIPAEFQPWLAAMKE